MAGRSISSLALDESVGAQDSGETGDIPALERRVCAAQLHEELMLQVQGRLLKEGCWLVVDSHSPDV